MAASADPPFVTFVEGELGEHLRGVTRYRNGSCEWIHVREDLDPDRDDLPLHAVAERYSGDDRPLRDDPDATLRVSEDVTVLHFPHGPEAGTLVSFNAHTAVEPSFVRACSDLLDGDPRSHVESDADRESVP